MALPAGTKLGPYKIVALLGRGGMGEVYRARDDRLGRDVAVKILPARFASDPERLRRFEREARAAGALNHPNILSIFDVGRHGDMPYVVSELLKGTTLRERLEQQRLPVHEAVELALQLADALAVAHDNGVVHRDLKPENVFVAPGNRIKILDFGLAKLKTAGGAETQDGMATVSADTAHGVVLGTAGYMAPEQVRGETTDHRCDIFSLGAIVYEMLTGARAFRAPSTIETMSAIVTEEPRPISECAPAVPSALAAIVHHCLRKQPQARFQSARDVALSIGAVGLAPETAGVKRRPTARAGLWIRVGGIATASVLAALAGGVLISPWLVRSESVRVIGVHRLTDSAGVEEFPAISADGKSVAFVADGGRNRAVFVRLVAGGPALQITRDARNPEHPRWLPDSSAVLYFLPASEGELHGAIWEASALGGTPRRIVGALSGCDVSHDGTRLAFFQFDRERVRLMVARRDGSDLKTLAELDGAGNYLTPRWSPDDRSIAYQRISVNTHGAFIVSASGGEPQEVIRDQGLLNGIAWMPDGSRLVFSASRGATVLYLPTFNLWTIRRDGTGLSQLTFGETSYQHPDVNGAGTIVATRIHMQFDIWRYPADGAPAENARGGIRVTRQTGQVQTPSAAPSGDQIVYLSDTGGHGNLWVAQVSSGETHQITFEQDPDIVMGVPIWSPSGARIAFYTAPTQRMQGGYSLIDSDGANLRPLVREGFWGAWSHDGRWFYYAGRMREGLASNLRIEKLDVERGEVVPVRSEASVSPAPAPDGRTLFFATQLPTVLGSFDVEVRVASPEHAPSRVLARIPSHRLPVWQRMQLVLSPDGRWLALPLTDGVTTNLWAISTVDGSLRQITDFGQRPTFIVRRVSWSPDSQAIFAAVGEGDADVVRLVETNR